jgi:hypothetical protein
MQGYQRELVDEWGEGVTDLAKADEKERERGKGGKGE